METLIICDIQPPYVNLDDDSGYISKVRKRLKTRKYDDYIIFYNGIKTCTMYNESDVRGFLFDCNFPDYVVYSPNYYDKGCGYYANTIIDYGIDRNQIVHYAKMLWYQKLLCTNLVEDTVITRRHCPQMIKLKNFKLHPVIQTLDSYARKTQTNFSLIGGDKNYCLLELEMTLDILQLKYKTLEALTYTE